MVLFSFLFLVPKISFQNQTERFLLRPYSYPKTKNFRLFRPRRLCVVVNLYSIYIQIHQNKGSIEVIWSCSPFFSLCRRYLMYYKGRRDFTHSAIMIIMTIMTIWTIMNIMTIMTIRTERLHPRHYLVLVLKWLLITTWGRQDGSRHRCMFLFFLVKFCCCISLFCIHAQFFVLKWSLSASMICHGNNDIQGVGYENTQRSTSWRNYCNDSNVVAGISPLRSWKKKSNFAENTLRWWYYPKISLYVIDS